MTKPRKILLYVAVGLWIFSEVFTVVSYVTDKSAWFQGLFAMLVGVFAVPVLMGLLWGTLEASGGATLVRLKGATVRMLAILLGRSILATIVCLIGGIGDLAQLISIIFPWTLGLGAAAFGVAYLVGAAVNLVRGGSRRELVRFLLIVALVLLCVLQLPRVFRLDPGVGDALVCGLRAMLPCALVILHFVATKKPTKACLLAALYASLGASILFLLARLLLGDLHMLSVAAAAFLPVPLALASCAVLLGVRKLAAREERRTQD